MAGTPPPLTASLLQLDPRTDKPADGFVISKEWAIYMQGSLAGPVGTSVQSYPAVRLTGQSASIPTTAIPLPSLTAGRYRLTFYARVTTVAGVSSSLIVTFGWTESGVSLIISSPALTGNTVTSVSTGTVMLEIDGGTALTYATTYASNPAATMQYRLSITIEAVP